MAGTLAALVVISAGLLFTAAVAGFGFPEPPSSAVATITHGAPGHRAGLLASVFVVGYLAFSVPAIVAGIAVGEFGLARTTEVYVAAELPFALLAVAARAPGSASRGGRPPSGPPSPRSWAA